MIGKKEKKGTSQKCLGMWICCIICVLWSSMAALAAETVSEVQYEPSMFIKEGGFPKAPSDSIKILLAKYPYDANMDLRKIKIARLGAGVSSSFEEYLVEQLQAKTTDIDVSSYRIAKGDIYPLFSAVLNKHPELYFVDTQLYYNYSSISNYVIELQLNYLNYDEDAIEGEVQNVLSMIDENMSDVEKVLFIHDYLCADVEYAYEDYMKNSVSADAHNLKGALLDKKAVCDGYAGAFQYYMYRLSIPCNIITGTVTENVAHAWNQVCLDGKWYLVDVTWDDPVWDYYGNVQKNYFLKSTADFDGHVWDEDDYEVCSDTTYDNAFWDGVMAQMLYKNGVWYYVATDGNLYKYDFTKHSLTDKGDKVTEIGGKWYVFGSKTQFWKGNYSRLVLRKGMIYYSQPDAIWSYDIATGKQIMQYQVDTSKGYVYGMRILNGNLEYQIAEKQYAEERTTESFGLGLNYDIADAQVILSKRKFTYTGTVQKPEITVRMDGDRLQEGSEYVLSYDYPPSGIGEVTVSVKGTGKYSGIKTAVYEIVKMSSQIGISNESIIQDEASNNYKISVEYGAASFSLGAYTNVEGADIKYESDNTNVAKVDVNGNVTIKNVGTANITLSIEETEEYGSTKTRIVVTVLPKKVGLVLTLEGTSFIYSGEAITPGVTAKIAGTDSYLTEGTDYEVSYENNVHVGTATLLIIGKGNYEGITYRKYFTIEENPNKPDDSGEKETSGSGTNSNENNNNTNNNNTNNNTDNKNEAEKKKTQQSISATAAFTKKYGDGAFDLKASAKTPMTYTSSNLNVVSVSSAGRVTIKGVGTAYITIRAAQSDIYEAAEKVVKVTVGRKNLTNKISLSFTRTAYTGKAKAPTVKITGLVLNRDYRVKYMNNVRVGQAKVLVTGIGKYQGTVIKTFVIVPQKPKAPKVSSSGKKKIKVSWKKVSCQGYEIVFSKKLDFKKIEKKVTVSGGSKVKKVVSKFKSKKTYYVKIRAYQKINGVKYYSEYSAKKKVKVK